MDFYIEKIIAKSLDLTKSLKVDKKRHIHFLGTPQREPSPLFLLKKWSSYIIFNYYKTKEIK